jgi:uncharacterized delta-60 repeat protein
MFQRTVHFPNGVSFQSSLGRHGERRAVSPAVEALEARQLLSAGSLDPTFGIGGKAFSAFFTPDASAVEPNGEIVVVGTKIGHNGRDDFAIARFKANGSIDNSFGSGGIAVTPIILNGALVDSFASGVNLLPNGQILVTGQAGSPSGQPPVLVPDEFAAVRYNANGTVDTHFGSGGQAVTSDDTHATNGYGLAYTSGSAVLADGEIVIAGYVFGQGPGESFPVLGVFSSSGAVAANLANAIDPGVIDVPDDKLEDISAVGTLPGNKVIVIGTAAESGTIDEPFGEDESIDVLSANGTLAYANDSAFIHPPTPTDSPTASAGAVATLSNGSYFTAGTIQESTGAFVTLAKYTAGGTLDTTFDGGKSSFGAGTVVTSINGNDGAGAIAVEPDGKILLAAYSLPAHGTEEVILLRYNANGSLDTSFGSKGRIVTGLAGVTSVSALSDGKIIIVGSTPGATSSKIEVMRYQG